MVYSLVAAQSEEYYKYIESFAQRNFSFHTYTSVKVVVHATTEVV
jgi:hypothetical protein